MTPDDFASAVSVLIGIGIALLALGVWRGIGALWIALFGEESTS